MWSQEKHSSSSSRASTSSTLSVKSANTGDCNHTQACANKTPARNCGALKHTTKVNYSRPLRRQFHPFVLKKKQPALSLSAQKFRYLTLLDFGSCLHIAMTCIFPGLIIHRVLLNQENDWATRRTRPRPPDPDPRRRTAPDPHGTTPSPPPWTPWTPRGHPLKSSPRNDRVSQVCFNTNSKWWFQSSPQYIKQMDYITWDIY